MARPVRRPGNLPAEATSFIGRRRELTQVRRTLGEARLVTLVGPGGVGKTRLAVRAAGELVRGFRDGAWLVELAEVGDPALVANAVLAALDLRDQAATEPGPLILSYLRDRQVLVVVDNCEHVLAAVARLLADALKAAPGLRVLATSREPLSLRGEHLVPVPPLDLEDEAVTLFAERAAARSGRFELTGANRAAVADVCRRLDGLPLAIELAAVRTRVLTPQQILARLTDRFGLLTGGDPTALPRHQTLRTAIDWSHDLLSAGEQALLRRLCVFAGRFTLDDVDAVAEPCTGALDPLSSLVDKSLVTAEDVRGVAAYRLHDTMREYAWLKLRAAGEEDAVLDRCQAYYLSRCRQAGAGARYALPEWLEWMDLEIDNIRSVLRRCLARRDSRAGLDLASAIGWYWITRATSEGIRWLDELSGCAPDGSPHPLALFLRGFLAILQSDAPDGAPALDRAVAAARACGHTRLEAESLAMASVAANIAGDRESAGRLLAGAEKLAAGLDAYSATISVLQARALDGLYGHDLDAARSASAEGARRSRDANDLYSLGMMNMNLGCVALMSGDAHSAQPLFQDGLRTARRIDDRVAQYGLLDALACHAARTGQPRRAARLLGAGETARSGVGAAVLPFLAPLVTRTAESTRTVLGSAAFQAEFAAGRRLSRADAVAFALGEPPAGAPSPAAGPAAPRLGRRETEVAHLVADGLSNKQIGARLFISEHTVDSHVRHILTKLGFSSRAQIAAWMASPER